MTGPAGLFSCLPVKSTPEHFCEDRYICSAFLQKLSVQADGEVVPCAPLGGYNALHGIHLGNVYEESLKSQLTQGKLLSSDRYKCVFFEKGYYEKYCRVLEGWNNRVPMN